MKKFLPNLFYKGLLLIVVWFSIVSVIIGALIVVRQFTATYVILLSIVPLLLSLRFISRLKMPDLQGHWAIDVVAVVFIVSWVVYNIGYVSQSVFLVRDPGVYTVTAKWLTSHKSTDIDYERIEGDNDAFYQSLGIWRDIKNGDENVLQPQGSHLLPGLLAFGSKLTNEKFIFKGNVMFGGLALGAVYLFAVLYMRRWWAFVSVVLLGSSLPFLYFARDAYTELIAVFFTFASLALVGLQAKITLTKKNPRTRQILWLIAGVIAGAGAFARPDGYLVSASILAFIFYERLFRKTDLQSAAIPYLSGFLPVAFLAYRDLTVMTTSYYAGHGKLVVAELVLTALITLAILLTAQVQKIIGKKKLWKKITKPFRDVKRSGAVLALLAALFLLVMYSRPVWFVAHSGGNGYGSLVTGNIQQQRGDAIDARRNYAELSFQWVSWYIGEIVFVIGLIGLVYAAYQAVAKKNDTYIAPLVVLLSGFLLYAIKPSITPDQIWAVRRFLPVAIPGMIVFSMLVLDALTREAEGRYGIKYQPFVLGLVSLLLLMPAVQVTKPFVQLQEKENHLNALIDYCQQLPQNAYVIWIGSSLVQHTVQSTRAYCGRQSAGLSNFILKKETPQRFNTSALKDVSRQLRAQGFEPIAAINGTYKANYDSELFEPFTAAIMYRTESIEQTLSTYPTETVESFESIELASIDKNGTIVKLEERK